MRKYFNLKLHTSPWKGLNMFWYLSKCLLTAFNLAFVGFRLSTERVLSACVHRCTKHRAWSVSQTLCSTAVEQERDMLKKKRAKRKRARQIKGGRECFKQTWTAAYCSFPQSCSADEASLLSSPKNRSKEKRGKKSKQRKKKQDRCSLEAQIIISWRKCFECVWVRECKKRGRPPKRGEKCQQSCGFMLSSLDIPPSFPPPLLPPSAGGLFVADHARILSVLRESPLLLRIVLQLSFCGSLTPTQLW